MGKVSKKEWYMYACVLSHFSHVHLFETLWTIAHQAPSSMGFSRHEYWNGLACLPPGDLPDTGIEPGSLMSPAPPGKTQIYVYLQLNHSPVHLKLTQYCKSPYSNKMFLNCSKGHYWNNQQSFNMDSLPANGGISMLNFLNWIITLWFCKRIPFTYLNI